MKSGEFHLFVFSLHDSPKTVIFSIELDVPFAPDRNSIPGQISQVSLVGSMCPVAVRADARLALGLKNTVQSVEV